MLYIYIYTDLCYVSLSKLFNMCLKWPLSPLEAGYCDVYCKYWCILNVPVTVINKTHTYSCGHVIIDTWSACEYEIRLDCAWCYPTALMHVSAVVCVWATQKQLYCSKTTCNNLELLYLPSTNTRVWICIKSHSSVNDNAATAVYVK